MGDKNYWKKPTLWNQSSKEKIRKKKLKKKEMLKKFPIIYGSYNRKKNWKKKYTKIFSTLKFVI